MNFCDLVVAPAKVSLSSAWVDLIVVIILTGLIPWIVKNILVWVIALVELRWERGLNRGIEVSYLALLEHVSLMRLIKFRPLRSLKSQLLTMWRACHAWRNLWTPLIFIQPGGHSGQVRMNSHISKIFDQFILLNELLLEGFQKKSVLEINFGELLHVVHLWWIQGHRNKWNILFQVRGYVTHLLLIYDLLLWNYLFLRIARSFPS